MSLEIIDKKVFETFCNTVNYKSFMQSVEMANLLEKRGYQVTFLGLKEADELQVAGVLYSIPVAGGLHMEINSGPASRNQSYLKTFTKAFKAMLKKMVPSNCWSNHLIPINTLTPTVNQLMMKELI